MRFSILKEIYGQPWHMEATTFQQLFPLVVGAINGAHIAVEPEPVENLPFRVDPISALPVAWNREASGVFSGVASGVAHGIASGVASGVVSGEGDVPGGSEKVVSVIPVRGAMTKHNQVCGPAGTRTIASRLMEADADPDVIGHVLVFETGGGSANSVPELSEAIVGCRKPTVAYVDGMMCSAGQYAGSYCREVMASRASDLVGSIGTMIVFEGRKAKSGENDEKIIHLRVYADGSGEKNQEFESAINDSDFKLVKERILNPHNEQFIAQVKSNRPGVLEEHLHGRAYPAGEVVGSLVDSIGSFDQAVKRVVALSGYKAEKQGMATDNINVQSQIIVSMKYPQMMTVLGLDNESFVCEADGRRTFTQEEMEAIELALGIDHSGGLNAALTETQSNLDAANNVITEREATLSERDSRIAELEAENASLRQQPAGTPAAVITDTDPVVKDKGPKPVSDKYDNPMDAIGEVSREYLNREL